MAELQHPTLRPHWAERGWRAGSPRCLNLTTLEGLSLPIAREANVCKPRC